MRKLIIVGFFFLVATSSAQAEEFDRDRPFTNPLFSIEVASSCMFKYVYTTGQTKGCVYSCGGSKTTIKISPDELCPIYLDK
jgi:hypothetical protein